MIISSRLKFSISLLGPLALAAVLNAAPQASNKLVPMPESVRSVVGQSIVAFGPIDPTEKIEVAISLKPSDPYGLQAFADAVNDPDSPMYRKFISPEEVGSRYGASATDVNAAKTFLTNGGLTVTHVGKNNMTVAAVGTRSQVESLFGTKIANLQVIDQTGTVKYRSNTTPLNVPSSLVNKIQSINGVETYTRPQHRTTELTPPLTRTLYGIAPLYNAGNKGSGRTVGISNWDGFVLSNGNLFITQYGLPVPAGGAMSNVKVVPVGTGSQNGGAAGEGDLDFQMVLGTAPLANIIIYDGTGGNLTTVLSTEASANKADIITESYGWNIDAGTAAAAHATHLAMAAQGITYMAASGDSGTDLEPFDYPDYDPEVLSVGGTDATTDSAGNRITEQNWGPGGAQGGGGGGWCVSAAADASPFNVRPSWQTGNGVPTNINKRMVPDVAIHATDYAIYYNGSLSGIGGTSAASPSWAGGLCDVEQKLFSVTGVARLGRIANKIYGQNGKSTIWFDITTGQGIGNLPNGQAAIPKAGWDFATGWGAVNFNALYASLVTTVTYYPFEANSVTPVAGSYLAGNNQSLWKVDSNAYQMSSLPVSGLGQVAGFLANYNASFTNIGLMRMSMTLNGPNGASAIISLKNQSTGSYETFTSVGMNGTNVSKTIDLSTTQIASYVKSNGLISISVRYILPTRGGLMPSAFLCSTDLADFSATQKS